MSFSLIIKGLTEKEGLFLLNKMKHLFSIFFSTLLVMILSCSSGNESNDDDTPQQQDPQYNPVEEEAFAFPGAQGFGNKVTGGRGGQVIKVSNLNDSGVGSLRNAILASGARIIVFDVSGTIELSSSITITNPNITIAGQTAPGDGITLKNHSLKINTDNVIIRYMRSRMGDEGADQADAMEGRYHKNIIIDHCSVSWSTDECASFYANENFTMQWCVLAESLRNSIHESGVHGYGGIWGGKNASFHHNLLAHHDNRNPRFDHPAIYPSPDNTSEFRGVVDFRNNVIYNWGTDATYGGEAGTFNMINNYYKPGPATQTPQRMLHAYKQATSTSTVYGFGDFYVNGNIVEGYDAINSDNWIGVVAKNGTTADKEAMQLNEPLPSGEWSFVHTAQQAFDKTVLYAGASLVRDDVDSRIVSNVQNGTYTAEGSNGSAHGIIDSQSDVGGWPVLQTLTAPQDSDNDGMPDAWELANNLNPNLNDASERYLSTAYDNIEVYINSLVKNITDNQY